MSLISKPRSAVQRSIAGSIGVSLFTQLGLLLSGVAGARILGVLDRGRSALLLLFATVLPLLGTLGTPLSVTYWIARDERIGVRLMRKLRPLIAGQTVGLLVIHACILVVVFRDEPSHVQIAAAISLLGTPTIVTFFYALAVLQGTKDFRALNLCRLIFPPLNAGVLIAMFVTGVGGLWLVTTVWVALYGLSALIAALAARRSLRRAGAAAATAEPPPASAGPRPSAAGPLPSTRELLAFGLKALLGSMSPLTGFQLDQAIVGLFISQAALGIYVVAVAFTNLPRFVAQSVGLVAYPHVAAEDSRHGHARSILAYTGLTLVLCGIVVAGTELVLPFLVPHLFGAAFASAVAVGRILLISSLFFCLTRVLSDCARGAGRPALGTVAEVVSLASLFPFVALLSASGAKGVAVALVLASGAGVFSIVAGLLITPAATRRARRLLVRIGKAALMPATVFAVAICGVAVASTGAGPAAGVAAGVIIVGAVSLLGISSDRLMWISVAILVLTIQWNGIRVGGGAFGDVFMVLAFAALIVHLVLEKRWLAIPPWLLLAGIGYALAALLSVIFPPSAALQNRAVVQQESLLTVPGLLPPRSDISFLIKFELSAMVTPLLVAAAGCTAARCRRLLDLWTIGAFVNASVAVADYTGVAHVAPYPIVAHRSSGLTIHPNYLALGAIMAIPSAMIWIGRSRRLTWAGVIVLLTLLGGVYASGSRAGAVAALFAVAATGLAVPRFRHMIVPLLPIAAMALVAVLTFTKLGSSIIHQLRLGASNTSAAGSNAQRGMDAHVAVAQITARPLEGVGFSVIQDAHDIYLQLLAAGGLVALAAFAAFLGGLFGAVRAAWAGTQRDELVATAVAVVVWLANGVFDNQLADKYLYIVPGLLIALSFVARAREPAVQPAAHPPSRATAPATAGLVAA